MASSLSSVPARRSTYDVFLSFRGEDTRKNFVDHLYASLVQRGIFTFKDDEMLRRGQSISPELLKAIEESKFSVIVFSENYANSSWCLEEIVKIMECKDRMGQRVLPVFYHVDPSDVRKQNGKFAKAFQQHEEKFRGEMDKLNKWREALTAASNLSGWHISKSIDGGESEFINKIVSEILGDTKPHGMENNLVGIESHMDALNSLLGTEATGEVRMVGIWGMGGIGKTTIAQALFRRITHMFEGSSFVKNVRENSSNEKDTCALQEKILGDVLMTQDGFMIQDPDFGAYTIQERFSNKKVLLVLDDVDDVKQLEFLAARNEWFGAGSRIIITTRNEHVLSGANAKYKPVLLFVDQALELFSRHAFKKNSPPEGYEELSYRAIRYAGCLPLALKVLGSFFRGRKAGVWESAFNRLAKTPNTEIFGTLKLSFDGLDVSEKKIFLDIACFFKGGDKEYITRILDSFGFDPVIGISVLVEKSLIAVSENRLDMHDLIQEMGWQIVRDSFSNSRLWQLKEIDGLIKRNQKLNAIEGILLWNNNDEKLGFSPEVFRSMENLRFLDIESKFTSHQPTFLPNELRWLCWYEYPFISLQVEHMCNLVGLQMSKSSIDHLWEGQKILPNLKYVDLSSSTYLTMFPDVSAAPNIEQLILSCCDSLVEVHESLGFHKRLAYLDMSFCRQLKCLPSRIEMESLETLILSQCLGLDRFPEVSPCMLKLSSIYLDYCYLIEDLPSSIRYLSGLGFLNLSGTSLKNIPNSVSELKHLKTLHLNDCNNLFQMPEELGTLEQLEELRLGFVKFVEIPISFSFLFPLSISLHSLASLCSLRKLDLSWRQIKEEDFPINLDAFSSLEELDLSGNSKLIQLLASISRLSNLKLLQLNDCHRLQNLNDLPSGLQVLKARGCSSLEKIGDLSKEYEWLYKIRLFDCPKLLEDQENRRYLDKMLEQSFLKKCAAVNHRLSIGIPGSNMPSWIKEQQHGCSMALKLPPKWHTQIMGFVVCGVFRKNWTHDSPQIMFRIVNDEKVILKSEVDCINASAGAHNGNVWIWYIPLGFFQQMDHDIQPKDWFHMEGNLVMTIMAGYDRECVRCGADILYKEDMESIQQIQDCISDYEDDYVKVPRCDNEHVYHEKC